MTAFKFGFHSGPGGNHDGIGDYFRALDGAGIPVYLKSVDHYGTCDELVRLARQSSVPHVIVYRLSTAGQGDGHQYDVPNYNLNPIDAAIQHWQLTKAKLPPEFDKMVWVEPVNEVDRGRADWLGKFALAIAERANAEGYKVTLFGWSSGEPEATDWETPGMLGYLDYCGAHPDAAAVSLHEYSYNKSNIKDGYPHKIGRFAQLFAACDRHVIPRPTVHITEWGWEYKDAPGVGQAIADMQWAQTVYGPHPQIKGAATWYLGGGENWSNICDKIQPLIDPVRDLALAYGPPDPDNPPPPPTGETWKTLYDYHFNVYNDYAPASPDWYDVGNVHVPAYPQRWTYKEWTGANPYGDGKPWNNFNPLENRIVWGAYIPQNDWSNFLNGQRSLRDNKLESGGFGIHCFAPNGATRFRYTLPKQTVKAGKTYRVRLWFYGDWCRIVNGQKTTAGLEPDHAQIEFSINGVGLDTFHRITMLGDNMATHEWQAAADGQVDVTWGFLTRFANAPHPNGVFVKGVWFEEKQDVVDPPPTPVKPKIVILKKPQKTDMSEAENAAANTHAWNNYGRTATHSNDDMLTMLKAGNPESYAILAFPERPSQAVAAAALRDGGFNWIVWPEQAVFKLTHWPTQYKAVTQRFRNNPDYYSQFGLPGHEGVDIKAPTGSSIVAASSGTVSDVHTNPNNHNYGIHVRIDHGDGWQTIYAHLESASVTVGQLVSGGQIIGKADNTGNSSGSHLHFTLKRLGYTYFDPILNKTWPYNIHDPEPELMRLAPEAFPQTFDMARYFLPASGSFGQLFILTNSWGAGPERCQLQAEGTTISYVTKNGQYEKRTIDAAAIKLVLDTSPGNGEYYTSSGTWLPRQMSPGQIFTRAETIKFFRKDNCQQSKSTYTATTSIRFDAQYATWKCPESNIALNDVIELSWLVNGSVDERYWFAAGLGLVRWAKYNGMKSWISELIPVGSQQNNVRETGCFGS